MNQVIPRTKSFPTHMSFRQMYGGGTRLHNGFVVPVPTFSYLSRRNIGGFEYVAFRAAIQATGSRVMVNYLSSWVSPIVERLFNNVASQMFMYRRLIRKPFQYHCYNVITKSNQLLTKNDNSFQEIITKYQHLNMLADEDVVSTSNNNNNNKNSENGDIGTNSIQNINTNNNIGLIVFTGHDSKRKQGKNYNAAVTSALLSNDGGCIFPVNRQTVGMNMSEPLKLHSIHTPPKYATQATTTSKNVVNHDQNIPNSNSNSNSNSQTTNGNFPENSDSNLQANLDQNSLEYVSIMTLESLPSFSFDSFNNGNENENEIMNDNIGISNSSEGLLKIALNYNSVIVLSHLLNIDKSDIEMIGNIYKFRKKKCLTQKRMPMIVLLATNETEDVKCKMKDDFYASMKKCLIDCCGDSDCNYNDIKKEIILVHIPFFDTNVKTRQSLDKMPFENPLQFMTRKERSMFESMVKQILNAFTRENENENEITYDNEGVKYKFNESMLLTNTDVCDIITKMENSLISSKNASNYEKNRGEEMKLLLRQANMLESKLKDCNTIVKTMTGKLDHEISRENVNVVQPKMY